MTRVASPATSSVGRENKDLCARRNWRAGRVLSIAILVGIAAIPADASSVARKKELARSQFETAERLRDELNGTPTSQRKLRDYKKVEEAYRRVYYLSPTSPKADPSIVALAELLVEQGRQFKSEATLQAAIGQYKFLRKEYPGSKYRDEALFTIGQIYNDDLNDKENAKATFKEFLLHYPHSHLADDVRQELKELEQPSAEAKSGKNKDKRQVAEKSAPAKEQKGATDSAQPVSLFKDSKTESKPLLEDSSEHRSTVVVTGIRHWSTPDYTRIAIDLENEVSYNSGRIDHPDRIYFDLKDTRLSSTLRGKAFDVDDGFLKRIRVAQFNSGETRVVLEVAEEHSDYSAFLVPNPYRLIIDVRGAKQTKLLARTKKLQPDPDAPKAQSKPETETKTVAQKTPVLPNPPIHAETIVAKPGTETIAELKVPSAPVPERTYVATVTKITDTQAKAAQSTRVAKSTPHSKHGKATRQEISALKVHEAEPTMDGDRSLIRALGLKIGRIVIDAGHGGHDTGTIGPDGLREKDVVLDVALKLGKLLEDRLGADVVYTRDDDTFVPLETRTAIANQQQADLFISIHANSSHDPAARGIETYYLNFTSSRDALEVAARENAVSDTSIHQLQDLVKKIALKEKIEESREFALDVQQALHAGLAAKTPAIRDRGVKKAPFIVLIGANMPSILAEISFISNPTDEHRLDSSEYREKIAESLYSGVQKYVGGLSGVKVAAKLPKEQGD